MSQDTAGFYKFESDNLLCGPNFVYSSEYTLRREEIAELQAMDVFPIDGWYWFDSIELAQKFFGINEPTTSQHQQ